jgi:hypothetical protein
MLGDRACVRAYEESCSSARHADGGWRRIEAYAIGWVAVRVVRQRVQATVGHFVGRAL